MSVNAPITSVDCRTEARSHTHRTFPDGFVTFIRFPFRAREGIGTLTLGRRLGIGKSRTLILLGLIMVVVALLWRWSGPLRLGRLPGDIVVEHQNFSFYFPITTGLLISAVLTLVLWLINR